MQNALEGNAWEPECGTAVMQGMSKILQWAQQGPTQRWLQDDQRELFNLLWAEKPCKIGSGEVKIQKVSLQLPL